MATESALTRPLTGSIWLLYVLIVFEILFMVSPFAAYYYAAYGLPLGGLSASAHLGWLTQHLLPHFAAHESGLATFLIAISWPLILIGAMLFLVGFAQIYWAKFTGKGAVAVGLYRHIRHPQYVGLALVGLGTTLFWSRYIVVLAFVTMLFLYYYLAVNEEARCRRQFGGDYEAYMTATGRFLPQSWTRWLPDIAPAGWQVMLWYVLVILLTLLLAAGIRHHVAGQLVRLDAANQTLVSLAPDADLTTMAALLARDPAIAARRAEINGPVIGYLVPSAWSIPELGLTAGTRYAPSARDELAHPSHHGNDPASIDDNWRLLVCRVQLAAPLAPDDDLLLAARGIRPAFLAEIEAGQVVRLITDLPAGRWSGIPVPVY